MSTSADEARRRRAAARRQRITIQRTTIDAVESGEEPIRGEAAISLVTQLTRAAWAMSGQALPTYSREEIPCVFVPNSCKRA